MSSQNTVTSEQLLALNSMAHLEDVLDYIDQLHTAASEGTSTTFTHMTESEIVDCLRDIIYTAREAIEEIEQTRAQRRKKRAKSVLRIVPKSFKEAG